LWYIKTVIFLVKTPKSSSKVLFKLAPLLAPFVVVLGIQM
jgi:hypothetical protein